MNTLQKRHALFLLGCIPTRLLYTYLTSRYNVPILGYIALMIGLGFLYIYFTDSRKTGPETFGEKIWWNDYRPLHGVLYLTFAYMYLNGVKNAWMVLLMDTMIGLGLFYNHHF